MVVLMDAYRRGKKSALIHTDYDKLSQGLDEANWDKISAELERSRDESTKDYEQYQAMSTKAVIYGSTASLSELGLGEFDNSVPGIVHDYYEKAFELPPALVTGTNGKFSALTEAEVQERYASNMTVRRADSIQAVF